ncbi:MAG: GntP family permease [Methanotrichaceae archaeon]|nr:GntP family permease [Methanotrichaceae archaeon]
MDPLPAFVISMVLISAIIPKTGPFLSLVVSAVVFGILSGMGPEMLEYMATGLGRIFSSLAVVVFSGAAIAEYLRQKGGVERIVCDLMKASKNGLLVSGAAGYLIALPVMCSITAFMILEPVMRGLGERTEGSGRRLLFMTSAASIISFNLVYPSPVMVTLSNTLEASPRDLLAAGLPISLLLFLPAYLYMRTQPGIRAAKSPGQPSGDEASAIVWLPLAFPMALILLGMVWGDNETIRLIGNPSLALLLGALLGLALAKEKLEEIVHAATRRSGVILLDLCGAGAFGYVIAQSDLGHSLYALIGDRLPLLLLPFLVSAVIQLAQGSRVVTAVVASQILTGYPVQGVTMALLIASGAFMFSYLTDPYFWLVKRYTGASISQMVRGYTLPLCLLGLLSFAAAVLYSEL